MIGAIIGRKLYHAPAIVIWLSVVSEFAVTLIRYQVFKQFCFGGIDAFSFYSGSRCHWSSGVRRM